MSTALTLGADGWIDQARRAPSPNCDAQTEPPQLLVIHHISLPPGQFASSPSRRISQCADTRS
jgi:AmpD protein